MHKYIRLTPVPRGSGKRAPEAAVAVLKRTENNAVGWGDSGLLHLIATEMGWPHDAWLTEGRVLDAIDRHNDGHFEKRYFRTMGRINRLVRVFYLPGKFNER